MVIPSFTFSQIPVIHFGAGKFKILAEIIGEFGERALIVTGGQSFQSSGKKDIFDRALTEKSITSFLLHVQEEPSPELIDSAAACFKRENIDVVCSIGGGSVIDAGKAVSAMILKDDSVSDYLEGIGTGKVHDGVKIPFIAVPTTAGTGSEATKNAVLSNIGPDGFKKSLRHHNFVPDVAVIDPELMLSCPPDITASTGLDAFTQLLESFVSSKATPLTNALAYSGISTAADNLILASTTGSQSIDVRAGMAYASFLSGITLANAGLGAVHGLASAIGGLFDIPHGVICGTLVSAVTKVTIEKLRKCRDTYDNVLMKYARAGALLTGQDCDESQEYCDLLVDKLEEWTEVLRMPSLNEFGVNKLDFDAILDRTDNKNNPVPLDRNEIRQILMMRLK